MIIKWIKSYKTKLQKINEQNIIYKHKVKDMRKVQSELKELSMSLDILKIQVDNIKVMVDEICSGKEYDT